MSINLSYVLVTPYSISKSRTGGILSRLLSRTDLELAGAQMITPDADFAGEYSRNIRGRSPPSQLMLLADYIDNNIAPSGGRPHRSLLLLFKGENPCEKLLNVCGHIYSEHVEVDALSGETIRDTYSDLIFSKNDPNEVNYFEPAVLTPRNQEEADQELRLMADFLETQPNIVKNVIYPDYTKIEKTLVIIKPDNWTHNSSKPGAIIDMFSRTGLRIVGIKVHRFSLAEALNFYAPVEAMLREKLASNYGQRARELLEKEFRFPLSEEAVKILTNSFGIECAKDDFAQIVEFMSGKHPAKCPPEEMNIPGDVKCMIMVYEGQNAIKKIRDVLGPTDPLQAPDGTVRKEFGSNIMVNTAHASDSTDSYEREKSIVNIDRNTLASVIRKYL